MPKSLTIILIILSIYSFSVKAQNDTVANNHVYKIGDLTQGGIVFWLDDSGQHGLVCAKKDQALRAQWDKELEFNGGVMHHPERNTKSVSTAEGIYDGKKNTQDIIKFVGDTNLIYAAIICEKLVLVEDSIVYDDWYLPAREELILIYKSRKFINKVALENNGDSFDNKSYWSSTDVDCSVKPNLYMDNVHAAWGHNFNKGGKSFQVPSRKYMPLAVRAIRAF